MKTEPKRADSDAKRMSQRERHREPAPDRGAVDRGDHRLAQPVDAFVQRRQVLLREVDERDRVHPLGAGRTVLTFDAFEVVASAEPPSGAGEDDGAHVAVAVDAIEGVVQLGDQPLAERVEPLGSVHGDEEDPGFELLGEHH